MSTSASFCGEATERTQMVLRDPPDLLSQKEQTSASATSSSLFPTLSLMGQDTPMTSFQAALLASMRSVAAPVFASQQDAISETPQSGEFQQKPTFTETGSSLAISADSKIGIIVSDTGADVFEGVALDTLALEFEPEPQRELYTPVLPTEMSTTTKPARREKKVGQSKIGKKPSI